MSQKMCVRHFAFPLAFVIALVCPCTASSAQPDDKGTIKLWCKGDAQRNDDPSGRDSKIRYISQEGEVLIDFDRHQLHFMDWGRAPLETVDESLIRAVVGEFDFNKDSTGARITIDRRTGDAYAMFWAHDTKQKVTWYPRIFAGKCNQLRNKF